MTGAQPRPIVVDETVYTFADVGVGRDEPGNPIAFFDVSDVQGYRTLFAVGVPALVLCWHSAAL